ncbi:hypothetical protein ACQUY5_18625 [Bacillus cereus]|uniref:hypothetical protein n=1 Tax=Bacillus cereus TaxID=1396 RepID=UPI003D17EC75
MNVNAEAIVKHIRKHNDTFTKQMEEEKRKVKELTEVMKFQASKGNVSEALRIESEISQLNQYYTKQKQIAWASYLAVADLVKDMEFDMETKNQIEKILESQRQM